MQMIFLVVLIVLTVMMSINNFKKVGQYRKDKTYIDIYTKILKNEEGAYEELVSYINTEADVCLKAKSNLIKIYEDLDKNSDEVLKEIDECDFMHDIFFEQDNFSKEKVLANSEVFIWLILILSKARKQSMVDVMNKLNEKVSVYDNELSGFVEYETYKSAYMSLLEKGIDGIKFLKSLLNGEYANYKYDKNLIGIFKKIAASLLAYTGEPLEEGDELLISDFATTLIGNRFTKDLEIYEKYHKEVETKEEATLEEETKDEAVDEDSTIDDSTQGDDTNDSSTKGGSEEDKPTGRGSVENNSSQGGSNL